MLIIGVGWLVCKGDREFPRRKDCNTAQVVGIYICKLNWSRRSAHLIITSEIGIIYGSSGGSGSLFDVRLFVPFITIGKGMRDATSTSPSAFREADHYVMFWPRGLAFERKKKKKYGVHIDSKPVRNLGIGELSFPFWLAVR